MKSKSTAIFLCFFLGIFGIHRFYLGHKLIGVIQLLTLGACGIWALIDFLRLIIGALNVNTVSIERILEENPDEREGIVSNSQVKQSAIYDNNTKAIMGDTEKLVIESKELLTAIDGEEFKVNKAIEGEKFKVNMGWSGPLTIHYNMLLDAVSAPRTGMKCREEFNKAADVLKFKGERWDFINAITLLIYSFIFTVPLVLIIMIMVQVTYLDNFDGWFNFDDWANNTNIIFEGWDNLDGWEFVKDVTIGSLFLSLFTSIFSLLIKTSRGIDLILDKEQKNNLKIIIESFKKIKPITPFYVTKKLNYGVTKDAFALFKITLGDIYFFPEEIAYVSNNYCQLFEYKKLSVKQVKKEVEENELPFGANAISDRVVKVPVYEGWEHENKDGGKDNRYKTNSQKVDHYDETKFVTYIKTDLNINEINIELLGDYKFPSLNIKNGVIDK